MSVLKEFKWRFVGALGRLILWLLGKSARLVVIGEARYKELRGQNKPVIILFWHGRLFFGPYFFRKRGSLAFVSPSEDGEILVRIIEGWGYKILRGSSSHSVAKAWVQITKELEKGGEVFIVPDGPKGPNRKLKLGALKLSQQTGAYLVPFSFSASRRKTLSSWDHFLLFYPFAKVVAIYGEPIAVDPDLSGDALERERQRIEQILIDLDAEADRHFQ
jgi:lysophospholipid acyltransferase (LPLAT)-like uncharacterized protein